MAENVDLKEIEQKTHRESQQDGLMEFVMGLCLLATSTRLISRTLIFMFPISMLAFRPALEALRSRFTYPRIGYVKLIPDKPKDVIAAIAIVTLIVVVAMTVTFTLLGKVRDFDLWLKWVPLWGGTVLAGMFSSFGSKSGSPRYYVFAVWSVMSGLVLSILNFQPVETGTLLYFLVMGLVLVPWGLLMFIRFLRKYPAPAAELEHAK